MKRYPILEFDHDPDAILRPHLPGVALPVPEKAVACFFQEVIRDLAASGQMEKIGEMESEIGLNPLYRMEWNGQSLVVFHPGVGAPLAAGFLEEVIAGGVS